MARLDLCWLCGVILTFLTISHWTQPADGAGINRYILDYQPVDFDHAHLQTLHHRVRRAAQSDLTLTFHAYGRTFDLRLWPAQSMFTSDHTLVFGSDRPTPVDTSFFYDGMMEGVPGSRVHVSIRRAGVSGHIQVPGDTTYHLEPAGNHFKVADFHTIIYPEDRMNLDPFRHLRNGSCGSQEMYEKLRKLSQPVDPPRPQAYKVFPEETSHNKYTAQANWGSLPFRHRRNADSDNLLDPNRRSCFMALQADEILYRHTLEKYSGGGTVTSDHEQQAKEELLALFNSHIKALNDIYSVTKFHASDSQTPYYDGIRFQLQRSTIITECNDNPYSSGYCTNNLDVSNFLDLTAKMNHDEFCLVHTFTYRDFVGGTLGLAWVATPNSPSSGFCGQNGNVRVEQGIARKSLNTGIVTLINFNNDVPLAVSQLTFAHEVGHNFGAQHDTTDQCAPYSTNLPGHENGNFIMFPSATQGNLPNNDKFSPCSKDYIFKVLVTMDPRGRRNDCFKASTEAFCGNKVVEGNETCDCGSPTECSEQTCCHGKTDSQNTSCQLVLPGKQCSPSQGACCKTDCSFHDETRLCAMATECTDASFCAQNNAVCPKAQPKDNYCDQYSKVCQDGQCTGSVCSRIQWLECFKTSKEGASDEEMCFVSCKESPDSECISSHDQAAVDARPQFKQLLEDIKNLTNDHSPASGVKRLPGYFCDDFKGYCDMFAKCQKVDAEGPFKQLTDMIFDPVTLNNIKDWIVDHWWAVLLMSVGLVVFMGVFVKIFSYNTPSKDPKHQARPSQPAAGRSRTQPDKPDPYVRATAPGPYNTFAFDNDGYNNTRPEPGHQRPRPNTQF